ncbi:19379_t:CDS:2 [Cetraspora pellucida]|uniref:19379_t:CDS:1 n=1 Tax=Cetraspora pellucida TaxID=1433469 RepID=A0A9N9GXB8_9GLOM|nr:19379_t:CDS:2 [Cetraspora pellucida]
MKNIAEDLDLSDNEDEELTNQEIDFNTPKDFNGEVKEHIGILDSMDKSFIAKISF